MASPTIEYPTWVTFNVVLQSLQLLNINTDPFLPPHFSWWWSKKKKGFWLIVHRRLGNNIINFSSICYIKRDPSAWKGIDWVWGYDVRMLTQYILQPTHRRCTSVIVCVWQRNRSVCILSCIDFPTG